MDHSKNPSLRVAVEYQIAAAHWYTLAMATRDIGLTALARDQQNTAAAYSRYARNALHFAIIIGYTKEPKHVL